MQMLHPNRIDIGLLVGLFHSSLNIPINYPIIYHPMVLLLSIASSNIADLSPLFPFGSFGL